MPSSLFRSFGLLAVRNILRSMFGLSVVYTSRWTHPLGKSSQDVILVHSTKVSFLLSTRHLYITSAVGLLCGGELPRIPIFSSKLSFLVYLHLNATKELWTSWELEMIQIQQTRKKNNVWKSPKMSQLKFSLHFSFLTNWNFLYHKWVKCRIRIILYVHFPTSLSY